MNKSSLKVSVVVPAYNAEKSIATLLESLIDLDYPDYEIIVVNDGSVDRTREIIRRYPVRLVDQPNRGASAARDAGLRVASGDIVAYADSDVSVTRGWLRNIVVPFSDPKVAATTGRTIFLRNKTCTSWVRSLDIERRNARRLTHTHLANGPNSAFRRDVLLMLGGFDPLWYHAEDTEVSYQILQRGYWILYVPDAIVYHVPEDSWLHFLRKRYRDAKAFTRMLRRYARQATLEDDYVSLGMKVQPPLFLMTILLAVLGVSLLFTPWGGIILISLLVLLLVAVLLNLPEALDLVRASRQVGFLFKGLGLTLLRGLAWGMGLGVGSIHQLVRR